MRHTSPTRRADLEGGCHVYISGSPIGIRPTDNPFYVDIPHVHAYVFDNTCHDHVTMLVIDDLVHDMLVYTWTPCTGIHQHVHESPA